MEYRQLTQALPGSLRPSILLSSHSRMTMTLIPQAALGFGKIHLKCRIILYTAFDLHGKQTPSHQTPTTSTWSGRCEGHALLLLISVAPVLCEQPVKSAE